jgi:hypothetical protein
MPFVNYICHSPYQSFGGISDIIPRIGECVVREQKYFKVKDVTYDVSPFPDSEDHLKHIITINLDFWFESAHQLVPSEVPS